MPNDCGNRLKITGPKEAVERFVDTVQTNDSTFDFNEVLPMPEQLNCGASDLAEDVYEAKYGDQAKFAERLDFYGAMYANVHDRESFLEMIAEKDAEALIAADQYKRNKEKYGYLNWYDWCCGNWGTKWNAYGTRKKYTEGSEIAEIIFTTAWGPPIPVVRAASEQFPDLLFELECWDKEPGPEFDEVFVFEQGKELKREANLGGLAELIVKESLMRLVAFDAMQSMTQSARDVFRKRMMPALKRLLLGSLERGEFQCVEDLAELAASLAVFVGENGRGGPAIEAQ